MPGARRRWIVVRKFIPVSVDERPIRNTPKTASDTFVPVRML